MSICTPVAGISPHALDHPFWEGLLHDRLCIPRCVQCRTWCWPPQPRCCGCGSWAMEWSQVPMRGEVYSFTRTHHPFTDEIVGKTPYVNVLVTLSDACGARLLGLLAGPESGLAIGAAVVGVVEHPNVNESLPMLRWSLARDTVG